MNGRMQSTRGRKTTAAATLIALGVLFAATLVSRREIVSVVRDASREVASIVRGAFSMAPAEAPRRKTRIVTLRTARAEDVTGTIARALAEIPEGRAPLVVPHLGTNSLIVQASPEEYRRIIEWIEDLDGTTR